MHWTQIGITIVTPTFLTGRPPAPAELRMPALRGAARFWFRALAAPVFADDTVALAHAEAEVFGAAGDSSGRGASPVAFRPVKAVPATSDKPFPAWLQSRGFNGIGYLLGPGLYQPPSGEEERAGLQAPRASYLDPHQQGTFAVGAATRDRHRADYALEVTGLTLWALATFGGLGTRVRRGFGGIHLTGLDQLSDALADPDPAEPPTADHPRIRRLHERVAERWNRPVPARASTQLGAGPQLYPPAPTWSRWHVQPSAGTGTWVQLLHAAGRALRTFRTIKRDNADAFPPYRQRITREYRDAVVPTLNRLQPTDRTFRIGAFGLPVGFSSQGHHVATVDLVTSPGTELLRRASPLWIRVYGQPDHPYHLLYHVFEATVGPPHARLRLTAGGHDETLSLPDAHVYPVLADFLKTAP